MSGPVFTQLSAQALQLLRDAVARATISHAARELGISRPAVSLLLKGAYKGNAGRMEARILARFGDGYVHCPHLQAPIAVPDCRVWRTRPMPTSSPDALRHWTACRKCPVGAGINAMIRQGRQPAAPAPDATAANPALAPAVDRSGGDAS